MTHGDWVDRLYIGAMSILLGTVAVVMVALFTFLVIAAAYTGVKEIWSRL